MLLLTITKVYSLDASNPDYILCILKSVSHSRVGLDLLLTFEPGKIIMAIICRKKWDLTGRGLTVVTVSLSM